MKTEKSSEMNHNLASCFVYVRNMTYIEKRNMPLLVFFHYVNDSYFIIKNTVAIRNKA